MDVAGQLLIGLELALEVLAAFSRIHIPNKALVRGGVGEERFFAMVSTGRFGDESLGLGW